MEQSTIYRRSTPVVDRSYESDGNGNVVTSLIDALAEAEGVAPTDLRPLYEVIDTEAIANLFERDEGTPDTDVHLNFTVDQWDVFISADGRIKVCDTTQPTPPQPAFEGNAH